MRCSDEEVRAVLAATLLLVALPTALLLGQPLVAVALLAPLVVVGRRLHRCLSLPDPWAVFERELDDLGVVVAEPSDGGRHPVVPARRLLPTPRRAGARRVPR